MAASSGAIRAGRAFVELFADDAKLIRGLKSAQMRIQAFGSIVRAAGVKTLALGSSIVAPFVGAAVGFAQTGAALDDMSQRTALSAETLSGLGHAAEMSATTLEEVERSIQVMQRNLIAGNKGFEALGLNLEHLKKLDAEGQLHAVADALSKVSNPTQRAALAMQVFGKSGAAMLPLMQQGAAGIRQWQKEAEGLGLVMSSAEASSAAEFDDALSVLWRQLKATANVIGSAVAPMLTDLLKRTQPMIGATIAWVRANKPLLANLFAIAAGVAGLGSVLVGGGVAMQGMAIAMGPAIKGLLLFGKAAGFAMTWGGKLVALLGTSVVAIGKTLLSVMVSVAASFKALIVQGLAAGASGLAGVFSALLTPIGLLGVAIVGLGGYVLYASGVFGDLLQAGKNAWNGLKETAVTAWGAIGEALARGDIVAAGKVAWAALMLEWTRGTNEFKNVWTNFAAYIQSVWAEATANAARVFVKAWAGVQTAWTHVVDFLADVWSMFTAGLMKGWHSTVGFVQKAWTRLKGWFSSDISVEAEIKKIDDETKAKNSATDEERNKAISEREKQRKEDLGGIDRTLSQQLESIDQQRDHKLQQIEKEKAETLKQREEALKRATEEFQGAVSNARTAQEEVPADDPRPGLPEFEAAGDTTSKLAGTFSSLAGRMFGAETDYQKSIAENTRAAAENTKQSAKSLAKLAAAGGTTWGN